MTTAEFLSDTHVIPVLTVPSVDDAVPLAKALVAGGLRFLEVTLRTPVALEAIRAMIDAVPEAIVGAGTVTTPAELEAVRSAGVQFAVSPAWTEALAAEIKQAPFPWLPGVMTPVEAVRARDHGAEVMKLFPANIAGGLGFLKAMAGPLPDLLFCPTGGVNASTFRDYLALPNVVCVGGSWVAPKDAVKNGDWSEITRLAGETAVIETAVDAAEKGI